MEMEKEHAEATAPTRKRGRFASRRKQMVKKTLIPLIVFALIGGAAALYFRSADAESGSPYQTSQVKRGDLLVAISATGTVEPEEVVDVGAQVAGQILSFGKDANGKTVDYGSAVETGTVLAKIDDSLYRADAAQADAQVESAQASLQSAKANLDQMKAKLQQAERDWRRAQNLGPSEALSQASYDAYQSAYEIAKANMAVGEAAIQQAKAGLSQAEALLQRAQRNLSYCTIKSPVKGVIIDRRVNIGQTVVSSLNAPSLFLIAKDLKRMQVWVAVNEADIGKIHPGQPVAFTVDAFPGETFRGEVGKVRLNASMTQNVVTYTVEIITDNSTGRLLPYLTANVQFELSRHTGVLLVPNVALRWKPSAEQVATEFREAFENPNLRKGNPRGAQDPASKPAGGSGGDWKRGVLWIPEGAYVRPLPLRAGLTDGTMTEVEGEGLTQGMIIVTGVQTPDNNQTSTKNPFTPQFRRRGGTQH
jgi:HlyD family secretion protein